MAVNRLAILIPANPLQYRSDLEGKDRSDIDAHIRHENLHGAVYWNVPASGKDHAWFNDVKSIYFVQPRREAPHRCEEVTHKGEILSIEHYATKRDMRERFPVAELRYFYGTRRKVWEPESNGGYDWNSWPGAGKFGFIFLKIRNIRPLTPERNIRDFRKAFGAHEPVKLCRKYVIVLEY